MIKNFCSLCGIEIKGSLLDLHDLPQIKEKRITISGDTVDVMVWISFKVNIGFLCPNCLQMYIEKLVGALAESRKATN